MIWHYRCLVSANPRGCSTCGKVYLQSWELGTLLQSPPIPDAYVRLFIDLNNATGIEKTKSSKCDMEAFAISYDCLFLRQLAHHDWLIGVFFGFSCRKRQFRQCIVSRILKKGQSTRSMVLFRILVESRFNRQICSQKPTGKPKMANCLYVQMSLW